MVRKRRTKLPITSGGSDSQEASSSTGHGTQHPVERAPPQQGGRYQGGRGGGGGTTPQAQYGGRGGASGGHREYQRQGGVVHQQSGGPSAEYQGRGYQPHGGMLPQQSDAAIPDCGGRHKGSSRSGNAGGHGGGGLSDRQLVPELHQTSHAPFQAAYPTPQISFMEGSSQASSSFQLPETADMVQQLQQLSIQSKGTSSLASQSVAPAASSKSMRFPLRPGKGSIGFRCIVKANHIFAELPDRDLHHYDVGIILLLIFVIW